MVCFPAPFACSSVSLEGWDDATFSWTSFCFWEILKYPFLFSTFIEQFSDFFLFFSSLISLALMIKMILSSERNFLHSIAQYFFVLLIFHRKHPFLVCPQDCLPQEGPRQKAEPKQGCPPLVQIESWQQDQVSIPRFSSRVLGCSRSSSHTRRYNTKRRNWRRTKLNL